MNRDNVKRLAERRTSKRWPDRLYRLLAPPDPFIRNPREMLHAPLGRWNLYLGGGGFSIEGYVNVDLLHLPGVNVVADAHHLPFRGGVFERVECDAVLEHVREPHRVMREIARVLAPGAMAHIVTPFCHPFHEYPADYHRFTLEGLKQIAGGLDVVSEGWRTGPTATVLIFALEYVKLWLPWRAWRIVAHGVMGWLVFPLRYLDLLFLRTDRAGRIGNHCYLWLRKP